MNDPAFQEALASAVGAATRRGHVVTSYRWQDGKLQVQTASIKLRARAVQDEPMAPGRKGLLL